MDQYNAGYHRGSSFEIEACREGNMDTAYLKQTLGDSLSRCLSEVSEKRPRDPIEYISQWLYKYKKAEAEQLEQQRKDHERDQLEEERAKKETTSPTKLPVVMEAQEPSEEAKAEAERAAEQQAAEEKAAAGGEETEGTKPPSEEPKPEDPPTQEPEGQEPAPDAGQEPATEPPAEDAS
ncbi:DYDC2-like protein [Mya arenaria]|uniref:DYDC2-like protein n=1 Tax=Mya arenaria TaxID=6604 RepID=A0ABY7DEH7_MYAAR|nr:DYDC2-like protein [Mya arenaria]